MRLDEDQLDRYHRNGFLVMPALFGAREIDALRAAFAADSALPGPHRIMEPGGTEVRSLYASHRRRPEFAALVRSPRLLEPARQLVGSELYVYQFKINAKPAFGGDRWAWHQDFPAWQQADNLRAPRLVNAALFLDEVTEFNGPLLFVPGSHRAGSLGRRAGAGPGHLDPDDIAVGKAQLATLVSAHGMTAPHGPAGSVVFFHPELVHGSAVNMSPFPRKLLLVTYNDVTNPPEPRGPARPDYLVGRDTTALTTGGEPFAEALA
ncbi:phytanoyl-CoA dioxygenase family protein [Amycolatopsis sp. OK19-0408]|uniref:Phytanoyl-CoA dioxygenase family protein n=1 Tax=Amycolatopsis iheyensis TaxID=2945988 RepID=A0A9X2SJN1_9PSEU|nr:phytanoyl-CoA dioxygenase family protein [Amycolatopsis iheyensis]MCR6483011.1 phytanoyl-CoA dioxygenase family protein [Amycolatopsis iheyensis]